MPDESKPIVHIIDDDPGMRKSLTMLAQSAGLPMRGYPSAEEFLAEADTQQPGCMVLDLRMPGMGGIELLQQLRAEIADIPVILISGHADVPTAVRGMKLGAIDFLQKPVEPDLLVEAIRRSLDLSAALHHRRSDRESVRRRFQSLTPRELEMVQLITEGHSNKRIAIHLSISVKTVANHRASLMTKTGAGNAADLARLYMIAQPDMSGSQPRNLSS